MNNFSFGHTWIIYYAVAHLLLFLTINFISVRVKSRFLLQDNTTSSSPVIRLKDEFFLFSLFSLL